MKRTNQINWLRVAISLVGLIGLSFSLAYFLEQLEPRHYLPLDEFAWLAYLSIFATTLVCSLTIIAPVPVATSTMIAAATRWNPIMVSLAASIGGTLRELSGYYAGYLGRGIAIAEYVIVYNRVVGWIDQYGVWAICFLALQPIIPFGIGGLIAGAARMPLWKFLPALWAGQFPKCVILCYFGIGIIHSCLSGLSKIALNCGGVHI